ncbi:hypothetical protein IWQ56_000137 [Coemansia nantahalensis]|uniref:Uncharacterized protein n=2 Tax=Coemansia TaxID=4863 RepID=A0ACC1L3S7_9FUNG|nr:hypothetical protein IWQ57_003647 [Coemansia nantahalensis]KAJ2775290.1 hypothetical protein IWQ56_000137 [Coemansia nantahalensis]KAJ2800227.1 hypothetical protein H4R21_003262 [Coemansia helicoidea]
MFPKVVISEEVFNEFMAKNYVIVFFPHEDTERFLEFRKDVRLLVDHLVEKDYMSYTVVRSGWTRHMKETRGVKKPRGVACFKKGVLKKELEGYDLKKFIELIKDFNPNGPDAPAADSGSSGCCDCIIL